MADCKFTAWAAKSESGHAIPKVKPFSLSRSGASLSMNLKN